MSNAGKSIFSCQRDLDRFLRMYIDERRTHGARASQPSASASPLLATPTMRSISRKNLFAKSRQALLGTDDGASQLGNPTNASEQSQRSRRVMRPTDKRNLWPGLWRLMPEWREIVIQNNGVFQVLRLRRAHGEKLKRDADLREEPSADLSDETSSDENPWNALAAQE